jgi:hypothetical protein
VGALRDSHAERTTEIAGNLVWLVAQLAPGDSEHAPSLGNQLSIAPTVALERAPSAVDPAAIELDHESPGLPEAIDLEKAPAQRKWGIEAGHRKSGAPEERRETLLEAVASQSGQIVFEEQAQLRVTSMSRVTAEELRQRDRLVDFAQLRLVKRALERIQVQDRGEVEERPEQRRHRDSTDPGEFVVAERDLVTSDSRASGAATPGGCHLDERDSTPGDLPQQAG